MRFLCAAALVLSLGCPSSSTPDGGGYQYPESDGGPLQPVPVLDGLTPAMVEAGSPPGTLVLSGQNFLPDCVVLWGGASRTATHESATRLSLSLAADDVLVPRLVQVVVVNPGPGGGPSESKTFTVTGVNPVPRLDGLQPSAATAGTAAFTLTVSGGNFAPASVVQWNGVDRPTTFVSTVSLTAAIGAAEVAAAGTAQVTVRTPAPGGGTSAALAFQVEGTASGLYRVSVADDGGQLAAGANSFAVSPDGRFVAFSTSDPNVVFGDTNGKEDVFVRDTCLGAPTGCVPSTRLVSLGADGGLLSHNSSVEGLSAGARFVLMNCEAMDVAAGAPPGDSALVIRDTCLGATSCTPRNVPVLIQLDGGPGSSSELHNASLSADGRYVAFVQDLSSLVPNDTNSSVDAFLRDTCLTQASGCVPSTELISVGADGGQALSADSDPPSMSAGARFVAFGSRDDGLVPNDTSAGPDIFVRDTCRGVTGCVPTTIKASFGPAGQECAPQNAITPALSPDGRYVAFSSRAPLGFPDTNGQYDVFLRDTCLGASGTCSPTTLLVSAGLDGGTPPTEGANVFGPMAVSNGGRYVSFISRSPDLALDDVANTTDTFVRDTCAGVASGCTPRTRLVSRQPMGPPPSGDSSSVGPIITPDGRYVVFRSSASDLVAGDTNAAKDIFLVAPGL